MADPLESLEQRVQRLEDAVATLQDTGPLEDRIVERVTERLGPRQPARAADRADRAEKAEFMRGAERRIPLPLNDHVTAAPPAPPPPAPEPAPPPPAPTPTLTPTSSLLPPVLTRHPWLILDLVRELRAMVRMFFDVRYHVGWTARVTILILLPLFFLSYYWVPLSSIPVVGTVLNKLVDLILAFLA
jgi:hypothetical protein